MREIVFYTAIVALAFLVARDSDAAVIQCGITAPAPPVDCSIEANLKRGWTPHVCRVG